MAQAGHHAAGRSELTQVAPKLLRLRTLRVLRRERELDAVLGEYVAGRHLAAECVAAVVNQHLLGVIGRGVHEHWHVEARQSQGVGNRPLVTEVRQCHYDAIELVAVRPEERGARLRLVATLNGPVVRGIAVDNHRVDPLFAERAEYLFAPLGGEVAGEEPAIADDNAQRDATGCRGDGALGGLTGAQRACLPADV